MPEPQVLTLDSLQENVVQSRRAGQPIRSAKDLTGAEKVQLCKLYRAGRLATESDYGATDRDGYNWWIESIFSKDWTSLSSVCPDPRHPPPRRFKLVAIRVGEFSEDARRKGDQTQNTVIPIERLKGAPVYLKVHIFANKVNFAFIDLAGQSVEKRLITLRRGVELPKAKQIAVEHYDKWEHSRLKVFNLCMMALTARRQIKEFAKAGTSQPPHVDVRAFSSRLMIRKEAVPLYKAMMASKKAEDEDEVEAPLEQPGTEDEDEVKAPLEQPETEDENVAAEELPIQLSPDSVPL